MSRKTNLSEQFQHTLSQAYCFCSDKIPGKGEDSVLMNIKPDRGSGICGVFDGCGGSGSRTYAEYGGHTGAYISSRVISGALDEWYEKWSAESSEAIESDDIKAVIDEKLTRFRSLSISETKLRGLAREFPSTAAMFIFRYSLQDNRIHADILWAGDSRVYILDAAGLHQITGDDVRSGDPMTNLRSGSVMSNVISASGKYELHRERLRLNGQLIIFAATDGCFEYVPSPMHFEHLLLSTLEQSESLEAWEENLKQQLGSRTGDDMSMSGIMVNFNTFREVRSNYHDRLKDLNDRYIRNYETLTEEKQFGLWEEYSLQYLPEDEH